MAALQDILEDGQNEFANDKRRYQARLSEPAADAAGVVTKPAGKPAGTVAKKAETKPLPTEQGKLYAFCINPIMEQETQLADIQYNAKHHCVGFECLVPTVNRIFYDYGLKAETRAKLTVVPARLDGCCDTATNRTMEYYIITPPKVR